jgi:hypothetical protein
LVACLLSVTEQGFKSQHHWFFKAPSYKMVQKVLWMHSLSKYHIWWIYMWQYIPAICSCIWVWTWTKKGYSFKTPIPACHSDWWACLSSQMPNRRMESTLRYSLVPLLKLCKRCWMHSASNGWHCLILWKNTDANT